MEGDRLAWMANSPVDYVIVIIIRTCIKRGVPS
jgi:hypothetical protein